MWDKTKHLATTTFEIFKRAAKEYGRDRVNRMSSAVAYRTMFALAPLLLVAVSVFGIVLGSSDQAQMEILDAINRIAGSTVEEAVRELLASLVRSSGAVGLVGFGLLLWTGSSLFLELQNDLNDIFGVPYEQTSGIWETAKKRGLGFLWGLGLGLVLVAVWLVNSVWRFLDNLFPEDFAVAHRVIGVLTPIVSVILLPFVFGLVFQTLSQVKVRWRAIWWGSFFTSVAFLAASYGTSLYFSLTSDTAAGIAAALFVLLLLAYILSAVFLFGAEVTKVYDDYLERGRILPGEEDEIGDTVVESAEPVLPLAAVLAFFGGLFIGWRRK